MSWHPFLGLSAIRCTLPLFCVAAALLAVPSARADLIIAVSSKVADIGSTGNTLEVDLTNTGISDVTVGAFSFGISTITPNIDFTEATSNTTAPYLFAGDSGDLLLFGLTHIDTSNGQSLQANDFSFSGLGDLVAGGTTVGLGEVSFDVSSAALPGPYTVTLAAFPTTSLADASVPANNLPFTGSNGTITLVSPLSSVPEPSTLLLFSTGLALLAARAMGRRRGRLDAP